jgi:tetratricopeptide (TPR) repeat protein
MLKQVQGEVQICRLKQIIENRTQALAAQEATGATILIWGRSDDDAVDVHLEVSGWDILSEDIWSFRGETNDFQSTEASHLTFLTQYSFSLLRYINAQNSEARDVLEMALRNVESQSWTTKSDNTTDIADAYFLLGLIYEEDETQSETNRLESARKSYENAIKYNPDSDDALLNKGYICMELDDRECAMDAFTRLIEQKSDLSTSAYINRAYLQPKDLAEQDFAEAINLDPKQGYSARGEKRLEWGDFNGAVSDLKTAAQLTPDDVYIYHSLGKVQLLKGDFAEAISTYNNVLPHLEDESMRQYFIDDLNTLPPPPNADKQFQETINQIIHTLGEAKLP